MSSSTPEYSAGTSHGNLPAPTFSVVIPCYQQARFLADAVESVVAQTLRDWECIIIDDGSPDDTIEVASRLCAQHAGFPLRVISQENAGVANARNRAIACSRGRYVVPLDADDRLDPKFLQKVASAIVGAPEADVVYTDIRIFGTEEGVVRCGHFDLETELRGNGIPYCAAFTRDVFDDVGGYDQQLEGYNDWDFWVGALRRGWKAVHVPEPLFWYRKRPEATMITQADRNRERLVGRLVLKHFEEFPLTRLIEARRALAEETGRRALICVSSFWPSTGVRESSAAVLAEGLADNGWEVDVLTGRLRERDTRRYRNLRILEHSGSAAESGRGDIYAHEISRLIESGGYRLCILVADPTDWVFRGLDGISPPATTTVIAHPVLGDPGSAARWEGDALLRRHTLRRLSGVAFVVTGASDGTGRLVWESEGIIPLVVSTCHDVDALLARISGDEAVVERVSCQAEVEQEGACGTASGESGPALSAAEDATLVSVVVVTKDRPNLLWDALLSLVAQSYEHWEAVVVNDGGVDVQHMVASIDPKGRIHYLRHPLSMGLAAARNTGISFSRGGILCYLDDDDLFLADHLRTVMSELRRSDAEIVYTEAEYVTEVVEDERRVEQQRYRPYSDIPYSKGRLHVGNFIPVNAWVHRRGLLKRTGVFDTTLTALEDWDLLLRIARQTEPVRIAKVTVEVRQRPQSQGDHMCQRERKDFPALYRKIYERYPVDFDPGLELSRRQLLEQLDRGDGDAAGGRRPAVPSYAEWVAKHALKESDAQYMAERMMMEWRTRPSFHLLVTHRPGEEGALADTIDSLGTQLYKNWGLSIVSPHDAPPGWSGLPNVEWLTVDAPAMHGVNSVVEQSGADWFVLLDAGTVLAPEALFAWADWFNLNRNWRLIYGDEDRIVDDGERRDPSFRPDFNLDLLRSYPYTGNVVAVHADLLRSVGGYDPRAGAAAYDLALKAFEIAGPRAIGHVPRILLHTQDRYRQRGDEAVSIQHRRHVLVEHLERQGEAAVVSDGFIPGTFFVDYRLQRYERVSIVVPQRPERGTLSACVASLLSGTEYPDFEVIVVADAPPAGLPEDARLHVVSVGAGLCYGEAVSRGVSEATGEFVLMMHDDVLVVQGNWLSRLVANGQRRGVGVVGARLVGTDQRVSHAGLVLGLAGTVGRVGAGAALEDAGYLGRLQVTQDVSAVSGACLLIRRDLLDEVGGLDAGRFPELFADTDLCLRVAEHGLRTVWTPFVTLVGSALPRAVDVGEAAREKDALHERWLPRLASDPAFNPNLSLIDKAVAVETELDVTWERPFWPRPRVWAFPLDDQGVGQYRVRGPLAALDRSTLAQVELLPMHERAQVVRVPNLAELARAAPDTLLVQHGYVDLFLDWIPRYRKHTDTFIVFGQDDNMFEVPEKNANRGNLVPDIERRVAEVMRHCDRLIVPTEPLADVYRRFAADIRVVPNHLEGWRWKDVRPQRRQGRRPRVGWAGAQQHLGDLDWLEPVVRALADEVEWVFMGMCPPALRPYVAEFHDPVVFSRYPATLAGLNLDLAIAPLEVHPFNESKSDLRILEYGILGWAVIATDIHPYRGKPVALIRNEPARWINAIRERINDLEALEREGDELRAWVLKHRLLEQNLGSWFQALFSDAVLSRYGAAPGVAA